ncbi:NAD(P)H-dependent oxidoreductase [Halpernia sp.]|uniref:NAD(P)H-dependent oxidoreductase n=1 Tax=Halpernia sp. TaxID=2782209 RepID=UPI003A8CABDE
MNYIDALKQRYSVKKFNKEIPVSRENLSPILEAGKLAASSLGLQPYRILVVESSEIKEKLIPAFGNPSQISTCSHLIVLISRKNIEAHYLDGYFKHITEVRKTPPEILAGFRNSIDHHLVNLQKKELESWAEKQTYIVLGNLMFAAALEKVDSCPMEGFDAELMAEILDIDSEKEKVCVTLALGYRADDDFFKTLEKVRKPDEKLFKFL